MFYVCVCVCVNTEYMCVCVCMSVRRRRRRERKRWTWSSKKAFDLVGQNEKDRKKERREGERKKTKRKGICQAFEVAGTFGVDGWSFDYIPKATLTYYFSAWKALYATQLDNVGIEGFFSSSTVPRNVPRFFRPLRLQSSWEEKENTRTRDTE